MDYHSTISLKYKTNRTRLWLLVVVLTWVPTALTGGHDKDTYSLERRWALPYDPDTAIEFLDPEIHSIPDELYGVAIGADGSVLVSDRITDRVYLINTDGEIAAILGQSGEGPEDHRDLGDPIFMTDGSCGVFDCSFAKKLVKFNEDGQYRGTIILRGYEQYVQLMRCGDGYLGLAVASQPVQLGGHHIDVYLASLLPNGAVRDTLWMKNLDLPPFDPDHRLEEDDFEIIPRLASGLAGRVFIQKDLYRWRIECFDNELRPLWTIEQDVSARERTPAELQLHTQQMTMNFIPSRYHHIIRQMVPRNDGSLWVRSDDPNEVPGKLFFSQWSAKGQRGADIVINGLPPVAGRINIEGEWLFWTRHADWEREAHNYEGQPYIALYRLVKKNHDG